MLKTTAIQTGKFDGSHNKQLPENLNPRPALEVITGDLLMTCAGPRARCGITALVRNAPSKLMISGKMYRFRPNASVCDPRYLELLMMSPNVQSTVDKMKTGISESGLNLTRSRFMALELPVPPLDEQSRIVDLLEGHLSRLDAALQTIIAANQKSLATMVSKLLHLYRDIGSANVALRDVVTMGSGGTPRSGNPQFYEGGNIPWVNSGDLCDNLIKTAPKCITQLGLTSSSAKWIPEGSVLMAMYGATIGRLGILSCEMTCNQAIACMTPRPNIDKMYLYWFLMSQRRAFIRAGRGGAQPNISQSILKPWPIPLPSLDQQFAIAQRAAAAANSTDRLNEQVSTIHLRTRSLRRALLAAAFSGRLTGRSTDAEVVEEIADSQVVL